MIDRIKVRIFLVILFLSVFVDLNAQNPSLTVGDSLFNQQKYTEAFEVYLSIMDEGDASEAMLLRMAYIQDGLGNYPEALFYLDHYYRLSADRRVIGKIASIAESNELEGFSYDDLLFFKVWLAKYRTLLIAGLTLVIALLMGYTIQKRKQMQRPLSAGVIQLMLLLLLFMLTNISPSRYGIIIEDHVLLRSGPSAGAEPVEVLPKGHKVPILDQDEVWTKILWEDDEVFVRNEKLKVI